MSFIKFIGETWGAGREGLNKDKNSQIEGTNPFTGGTNPQGYSQLSIHAGAAQDISYNLVFRLSRACCNRRQSLCVCRWTCNLMSSWSVWPNDLSQGMEGVTSERNLPPGEECRPGQGPGHHCWQCFRKGVLS